MELNSLLVFCSFIVLSVLVVIIVSVFGIREKSYEEAIAEQKRKAQEIASQVKTDKVAKEKKKKHLKKSKEKLEKTTESDENVSHQAVDSPPAVLPPAKPQQSAAKGKASSAKISNKPKGLLASSRSADELEIPYLEIPSETKKAEPKKEIVEQPEKLLEKEVKRKAAKESKAEAKQQQQEAVAVSKKEERRYEAVAPAAEVKQQEPGPKNEPEPTVKTNQPQGKTNQPQVKTNQPQVKTSQAQVKIEAVAVKKEELSSLPPSPAKKVKKQKFDIGSGDNGMNGTHLATVLRNAILTDTELQTLIDILLNRQQEGESWVKLGQKIDPISALKKQLQETQQNLTDEQLVSQTTSNKVKEMRQELNKSVQMERSIREKFMSQQQEMQNLQVHLQRAHDQHVSEMNALQISFQQRQVKAGEEHHLALQRLQEENEKLQQALAQLETNAKNVTSAEIAQLQCETEQWRMTCEQYKEQLNSNQKAHNELQQRSHQFQQCIQELTASKSQQEKALQQEVNDLMKQLGQSEAGRGSLQRDLCNYQNLQAENTSLHNRILDLEKANDSYCRSIKELEDQMTIAESVRVKDNEERYHEMRQQFEQYKQENQTLHLKLEESNKDILGKESLLTKQQNDLAHYLDEVQQLTKALELQRQKNNDLREKNWKTVEALSGTEKLLEEKLKQAETKCTELMCNVKAHMTDVQEALSRIYPTFTVNQNEEPDEWLLRLEVAAKESQLNSDFENELQSCRANALETEKTLTSQVQHYQEVLRNTELVLTSLERRVEDEELVWREKLSYKDNELAQIQGLLSELHGKLLIEENERKLVELKSSEAQKEFSNLQQKLNDKSEDRLEEQKQFFTLQDRISDLEEQLEAERKMSQDLTAQNMKLNSLVCIGQDSLKAEQVIVQELQKKIAEQKVANNTTNGTSCTPSESIANLN